jgi:uncharacterized protein (TIGR00266 family)
MRKNNKRPSTGGRSYRRKGGDGEQVQQQQQVQQVQQAQPAQPMQQVLQEKPVKQEQSVKQVLQEKPVKQEQSVKQVLQGQPVKQEQSVKQDQSIKQEKPSQKQVVKKDNKCETKRIGSSGSVFLQINLKENQQIMTSPGALLYMKGNIEKGEIKFDSVGSGFWRILGGESLFYTSYKGNKGGGTIAVGTDVPGDIIDIPINSNEEWYISRGSYLCSTLNIVIEGTVKTQGLFGLIGSSEGAVLPIIKTTDGNSGKFWLGAYGSFEKIVLNSGQDIVVDNGYFLAAEKKMDYTIVNMGKTLTSAFFGGEGFGMKFVGPGTLYIQSKNISNFAVTLSSYMPKRSGSGNNNSLFNFSIGDGNDE